MNSFDFFVKCVNVKPSMFVGEAFILFLSHLIEFIRHFMRIIEYVWHFGRKKQFTNQ